MSVEQDSALPDRLRRAAQALRDAGVDTPTHDAKVLAAAAYGLTMQELNRLLIMREEPKPLPDTEARWRTGMRRRVSREPLQYILGRAPFRYLTVRVGPGVFIPRPETETAVQIGLDWLRGRTVGCLPEARREAPVSEPVVVDLCAGSGVIGLCVVSELDTARVWAVEKSSEALAWAERNRDDLFEHDAGRSHAAERYHLVHGDATDDAVLTPLDARVDAVITNPPYVPQTSVPQQPEVRDHDPSMALFGGSPDGLRIPEAIIERSARLLKGGGLLVMEHDTTQAVALVSYALSHGFARAATGDDLTGRARYLVAIRA